MAMGNSRMGVIRACLVMLLLMIPQTSSSAATTHTVGDSSGWTVPSTASLYSNWADSQTFQLGDVLLFDFQTGSHTVAEVSKADYDACSANANPISAATNGPASVTIETAGAHYYICTIPGHCSAGQKLAITTATASTPTSTTTTTTTNSSPSSATTLASAALMLPFLSIVIGAAILLKTP